VILLAESLAASEVTVPELMLPRTALRALAEQQRDHHERAIVSIHDGDVAS
jgi:hypothetical protein